MSITEVVNMVIARLGDNYKPADSAVLLDLVKKVIFNASFISNREIEVANDATQDYNIQILSPEIIDASVIAYENRGVEGSKSKSELGESNTFVDYTEKLRNDIIKNGKRIVR